MAEYARLRNRSLGVMKWGVSDESQLAAGLSRLDSLRSIAGHGPQRLSLLASLINAVVLTAGSTLVIANALPRLASPSPSHAMGMVGLAVLGIAVNGWAAYRTSKGKSMNESVISWHLLEDVLGWAAVLVGA